MHVRMKNTALEAEERQCALLNHGFTVEGSAGLYKSCQKKLLGFREVK